MPRARRQRAPARSISAALRSRGRAPASCWRGSPRRTYRTRPSASSGPAHGNRNGAGAGRPSRSRASLLRDLSRGRLSGRGLRRAAMAGEDLGLVHFGGRALHSLGSRRALAGGRASTRRTTRRSQSGPRPLHRLAEAISSAARPRKRRATRPAPCACHAGRWTRRRGRGRRRARSAEGAHRRLRDLWRLRPHVGRSIALAYLEPALATADAALTVEILGERRAPGSRPSRSTILPAPACGDSRAAGRSDRMQDRV